LAVPEIPADLGPYRFESILGAGGMGVVYRAWDQRLERPVAIKRMLPRHLGDRVAQGRFRREARAAARLQHPGIVQIFDLIETPDVDWLVMELVEGERLSERVERGRLELYEALDLVRQVAEGIHAAQARGVVHRDLKTENVLVTATGQVKVLDFGLARMPRDETLTEDGAVVGTRRAMSPEQVKSQAIGPSSDLFSLGVLLYEVLAGRSPFLVASEIETLRRIVSQEPTPIRELRTDVPIEVANLIDRLLRKEPGQRPLAAEAAAILQTHSTAQRPATPWPAEDADADAAASTFAPPASQAPRESGAETPITHTANPSTSTSTRPQTPNP